MQTTSPFFLFIYNNIRASSYKYGKSMLPSHERPDVGPPPNQPDRAK